MLFLPLHLLYNIHLHVRMCTCIDITLSMRVHCMSLHVCRTRRVCCVRSINTCESKLIAACNHQLVHVHVCIYTWQVQEVCDIHGCVMRLQVHIHINSLCIQTSVGMHCSPSAECKDYNHHYEA